MARRRNPARLDRRPLGRRRARGLPASTRRYRGRRDAVAAAERAARPHRRGRQLAGKVVEGPVAATRRGEGAPLPAPATSRGRTRCPSSTRARCPTCSRPGRDIVHAAASSRTASSSASRARSSRSARRSTRPKTSSGSGSPCPSSAAPRSSSRSGWRSTRSLAGALRGCTRPPPARRLRAERAPRRVRRDAPSPRRVLAGRARSRDDFSFTYVAEHTSRDAAARLHALGLLGRPGGLAAALAARPDRLRRRRRRCSAAARAGPPRRGSCRCSAASRPSSRFLLVAVASPFATQAAPPDGAGLNPSLQNPYMLAHPPLLYLGYVGLTIPWAFAMGALLARRGGRALDRRHAPLDARRLDVPRHRPAARRALGLRGGRLGRLLRLGSGRERGADALARGDRVPALGDDPGEARDAEGLERRCSSSLAFGALALRHVPDALAASSTRSTRSRRARSGRGSSASSPSSSPCSIALIVSRLPLLRSRTRLESLVSREATFLYNNLLLVALCLTILWGVAFPLVSEAVRGEPVTVGAAVLQLLPARVRAAAAAADGDRAARRLAARLAALARPDASSGRSGSRSSPGAVLLALGAGSSIPGLVGVHLLGVRARVDRARVRPRDARPQGARRASVAGGASPRSSARNRRRYGGYVVHAAIVLLAIGIAGSSAYDDRRRRALAPGETMAVGDYTLTYARLERARRRRTRARRGRVLAVERGGDDLGTLEAGQEPLPRRAAGVERGRDPHATWLTGEDLFVIADQFDARRRRATSRRSSSRSST